MKVKIKKMLRCPFCGGKGLICYDGENRLVICKKCFSEGPSINTNDYDELNQFEIYNVAIDAWNKRV